MNELRGAIESGVLPGRVWLYSNYTCNLSCKYCLTESSPKSERRLLDPDLMVALTREAAELGFTGVGVTGGEPFLLKHMPELLQRLAEILPVLVLTNATLFTRSLLERMRPLAKLPVTLQVSLDSADADRNDANRGKGCFEQVVDAIPKLLALGIEVRIATTGGNENEQDQQRLRALYHDLGIPHDDHVVRPIVRRGRAHDRGVEIGPQNLPPELTITSDGAFWGPFAPTVRDGRLDADLLISRRTSPLRLPAEDLLALVIDRPAGADAVDGIP